MAIFSRRSGVDFFHVKEKNYYSFITTLRSFCIELGIYNKDVEMSIFILTQLRIQLTEIFSGIRPDNSEIPAG